jgi:cardiolipin synthase
MYIAIIFLIALCLFIQMLLFEDMKGEQMLVWTIVLFGLPLLGSVLYIMLGSSMTAKTLKSRRTIPPELKATLGNDAALFCGWEESIPMMQKDMDEAEKTIDLGFYGFSFDEQGQEWLNKLCDAASRGVKVRVLIDAFGSFGTRKRFFKPLLKLGGEVHKVRPWPTHFRYHRKLLVVDGQIAWSGSMNIGKKYIDKHPFKKPWYDIQVRVEGEAAAEAEKLFLYDWRCNVDPETKPYKTNAKSNGKGMEVSILYCGVSANKYEIHDTWIDLINKAKETLVLQTPYLLPDEAVMAAIKSAIRRGVQVSIMLPQIPSGPQLEPVSNENAAELYCCGANIILYPGYMHSKTLCKDSEVTCIGSVNLDTRSMMIDDENCAMIRDASFGFSFMDKFGSDEKMCKEFDPNLKIKRPVKTRILRFFYSFL